MGQEQTLSMILIFLEINFNKERLKLNAVSFIMRHQPANLGDNSHPYAGPHFHLSNRSLHTPGLNRKEDKNLKFV